MVSLPTLQRKGRRGERKKKKRKKKTVVDYLPSPLALLPRRGRGKKEKGQIITTITPETLNLRPVLFGQRKAEEGTKKKRKKGKEKRLVALSRHYYRPTKL